MAEKSMAEEMRAYGMDDYEKCATYHERDLEEHDEQNERLRQSSRMHLSQRASSRFDVASLRPATSTQDLWTADSGQGPGDGTRSAREEYLERAISFKTKVAWI